MGDRREQISHVVRRLSMGTHPDLVGKLADVDAAVASALDLSVPPAQPLEVTAPAGPRDQPVSDILGPIGWWVERMRSGQRLVEERLTWFWHDHFATSIAKVPVPYLMYRQHLTIRQHATGSFADLLHALATDPAMLLYLDGITNAVGQINENFGRECLELFTMGIGGGYSQQDVVEASRAFSGWAVNVPGRRFTRPELDPWGAYFVPRRHDADTKTFLGVTADLDLPAALDVILEHLSTPRFVAAKLYRELVGLEPDDATAARLGDPFGRDYQILPLVEAIAAEPAFISDAAVRSRPRSPVEKLVGLLQAVPGATLAVQPEGRRGGPAGTGLIAAARVVGYIPFAPPNVGGFPTGESLLGPHQLVHAFDLLAAISAAPPAALTADVDGLFARFGVFDVSERSRRVVAGETDPGRRLALAFTSPEFTVT